MMFMDVLYSSLVFLGLASYVVVGGFPIIKLFLSVTPYIFMAFGFLVYIFSEKYY